VVNLVQHDLTPVDLKVLHDALFVRTVTGIPDRVLKRLDALEDGTENSIVVPPEDIHTGP